MINLEWNNQNQYTMKRAIWTPPDSIGGRQVKKTTQLQTSATFHEKDDDFEDGIKSHGDFFQAFRPNQQTSNIFPNKISKLL